MGHSHPRASSRASRATYLDPSRTVEWGDLMLRPWIAARDAKRYAGRFALLLGVDLQSGWVAEPMLADGATGAEGRAGAGARRTLTRAPRWPLAVPWGPSLPQN